jgi:hypothetical protein
MSIMKASINHNICTNCLDDRIIPLPAITAETGVCCECGKVSDVWDIELLQLYEGAGIGHETIFQSLPRLRCSHIPGAPRITYDEIGQRIAETFQGTATNPTIATRNTDASPPKKLRPRRGDSELITREEYDVVKQMIRGYFIRYYLLELPSGQWGALWDAGLKISNAWLILDDNYGLLAFTGTQSETQNHIYNEAINLTAEYRLDTPVDSIKRMFRYVKPGRKSRTPRYEDL